MKPSHREPQARGKGNFPTFLAVLALLLGCLFAGAGATQAREGFYVELGAVNHSIQGDLQDSPSQADDKGSGEAHLGAPETGSGFIVGGGYGFTPNLALDIQLGITAHDANYAPAGGIGEDQTATLRAGAAGLRLTFPLGPVIDVFGRLGVGGYELVYRDANVRNSDGKPVGDVRLLGSGTALSAGLEWLLGSWGVALVITRHEAQLTSVDSPNFEGTLRPALDMSVTAGAVQIVYNFP